VEHLLKRRPWKKKREDRGDGLNSKEKKKGERKREKARHPPPQEKKKERKRIHQLVKGEEIGKEKISRQASMRCRSKKKKKRKPIPDQAENNTREGGKGGKTSVCASLRGKRYTQQRVWRKREEREKGEELYPLICVEDIYQKKKKGKRSKVTLACGGRRLVKSKRPARARGKERKGKGK